MFVKEDMKVNLALSKRSVEFFKAEAKRRRTQFQQVIREFLDAYVNARLLVQANARNAGKASKSRVAKTRSPEWTAAMVAEAQPAREVLQKIFGEKRAGEMLKPRQKQK